MNILCKQCQKPVEKVSSVQNDSTGTILIYAKCHGQEKKHTLELYENPESITLDFAPEQESQEAADFRKHLLTRAGEVFESRGFPENGATAADTLKGNAIILHAQIQRYKEQADAEAARCFAKAQTDLEQAVMWAVKGVSRLKNPIK